MSMGRWFGLALILLAGSIVLLLLAHVTRPLRQRGLTVGAFACHDCTYSWLSFPLPPRQVRASIDNLSEQHMGHQLWSSSVDV